jgi:hypothetical protein
VTLAAPQRRTVVGPLYNLSEKRVHKIRPSDLEKVTEAALQRATVIALPRVLFESQLRTRGPSSLGPSKCAALQIDRLALVRLLFQS